VRVDGEESYKKFREDRRQHHLNELNERLTKLEKDFAAHVSDGHGGKLHQQMVGALLEAERGGKPINLGLASYGFVHCWMDGDEAVCSAKLNDRKVATTGETIDDAFKAVVGAAESIGCCGLEALVLGATLAPVVTGRRLLGDLTRAKEALCGEDVGFVGALVPETNVEMAALMTLQQRCQRGDRHACREVLRMTRAGHGQHVRAAANRLLEAQTRKAGGAIAQKQEPVRRRSWWSRLWS
jgi:hypothetical protein